MATETDNNPIDWTNAQLETAGRLISTVNNDISLAQSEAAKTLLMEASAVIDMVEDQTLDAVLELRAQLCNELGFHCQRSGNPEEALKYHTQAADYCDQLLERGAAFRANTTATLINLAGVLTNTDISLANEKITKATELIKSLLDENPDDTDSYYLGFGAFQAAAVISIMDDHRVDDAHKAAESALVYAEKTFQDNNLMRTLQAANAFQQLAVHFFQAEDLDHAIHWGKKSEEIARIAFDIEKEPAVPVFVQTQLFLILFHENKGNYSEAEDALYNAIDVLGNHPQLLERGRDFYLQCRKQTDKRLEEGGLPRDEVEEGLKEIEARIEAFGGPEKLAQVLAEMQQQEQ